MIFALLVCCVLFVSYKISTWNFSYWSSRNVVGPRPVPFFGNFLKLALNKEYGGATTAEIYRSYPNEKFVGIYRFNVPVILVRDLELIKHILVKDFVYFQDRGIEFSKEGFGTNLFHSDGNTWAVLRKKFTPLFTSAKIKGMFYLIKDKAEKFTNFVDTLVGEDLEMHRLSSRYTGEIISTCTYGVDIDAFNTRFNQFLHIGYKQFSPTWRLMLDLIAPGSLKMLGLDLFTRDVVDHYHKVVRTIISERKGKPKIRRDFMDMMMEMHEQGSCETRNLKTGDLVNIEITETVMAAQAFIFFGAGFETSSTTISLAIYELALHPDIQDNVYEEVKHVFSKYEGELTYESIQDMTYMDKIVMETLRKYPVVDITRKSVNKYKIPGSDVTLDKGTHIVISPLGINYDPKYYPDPEKFDPERFSSENSRNSFFLPFGAGPRECIGLRFASITVKACLAHFLFKFRVGPCSKTSSTVQYGARRFTLHPEGGVWIKVSRR